MEYSGMILDELRKTNKLLERVANTLVDIETLIEQSAQRSLTTREAVAPKQTCPSCDGVGHTLTDGAYSPCMTCYGSGQV
jgi:hypothetical protein